MSNQITNLNVGSNYLKSELDDIKNRDLRKIVIVWNIISQIENKESWNETKLAFVKEINKIMPDVGNDIIIPILKGPIEHLKTKKKENKILWILPHILNLQTGIFLEQVRSNFIKTARDTSHISNYTI